MTGLRSQSTGSRFTFQSVSLPFIEVEIMNVSTGTLRRMYRSRERLQTLIVFDHEPADSFKKWVKLNAKLIVKYYDHRPAFTYPAAKLLGIG
jgi:hypothetical protein